MSDPAPAPSTPPPKRRVSRGWLVFPWITFALLAAAWCGYWLFLAGQAEARFAQWAEGERRSGALISYSGIVRHGFPALMRLEIRELSYAPARGGWSASTPRTDLHIEMLNPEHIIFKAEAPITIARADGANSVLEADSLIASVRTQGGALAQAGVEGSNLRLDDPAKDGVLSVRRLIANVRPDVRASDEYQVAFETTALTLPRPVRSFEQFGLEVATIRAAAVIEHGADLLDGAPGDPLGPWRTVGGRVRFEALELNWGPLQATGTGAGGLDAERRLQGALTLPITRPGPIFTALANDPGVDQNTRRALALLAAGYAISGDDLTLDVEAANGLMRLEGLPVRSLPPVY